MSWEPQRTTTRKKYLAIQQRYQELYNIKRIRHDDCILKLMEEFYIEHEKTVMRILATEVPEVVKKDPNQMELF